MTAAGRLLFWAPRLLCLAFALVLALFALDEFTPDRDFLTRLFGVAMHLLPSTVLVLVVLAGAWRHDLVGAVGFTALGVAYLAATWGRFPLTTYVGIAGPLFVAAALFLANWIGHRTAPASSIAALQR